MTKRVLAVWAVVLLVCCLLPASERVELDRRVGRAESEGLRIEVHEGLASVRVLEPGRIELWAQAPAFDITLWSDATQELTLDVLNCVPGARLRWGGDTLVPTAVPDFRASCRFVLSLTGERTYRFGPVDEAIEEPYSFAVMSDVQSAVNRVQDVFSRISDDPDIRFVVSTGDLVDTGVRQELRRFQNEMRSLRVPLFSTVGNHEMGAEPEVWHELFGPFNVNFQFKGVHFSLIDSGNATVDPHVYDWMDEWLDAGRRDVHVALTHLPPLDPVGLRSGAFRSRKEGAKFMQRLAGGRVDALFLGHIHSFYQFSAAGVPSFISGGGGAIEERLDGIQRHFLKVRVVPGERIDSVAVVRVDE